MIRGDSEGERRLAEERMSRDEEWRGVQEHLGGFRDVTE